MAIEDVILDTPPAASITCPQDENAATVSEWLVSKRPNEPIRGYVPGAVPIHGNVLGMVGQLAEGDASTKHVADKRPDCSLATQRFCMVGTHDRIRCVLPDNPVHVFGNGVPAVGDQRAVQDGLDGRRVAARRPAGRKRGNHE